MSSTRAQLMSKMSKSVRYINNNQKEKIDTIHIIQPRKKRRLSPNKNNMNYYQRENINRHRSNSRSPSKWNRNVNHNHNHNRYQGENDRDRYKHPHPHFRPLQPKTHKMKPKSSNNHQRKNVKFEQDLYQTNIFLKKKLKTMQEIHEQQMIELKQTFNLKIKELKQRHSIKESKLESKAVKLTTNFKKLGKMYQNLQKEYDKLLEQHQELINIVNNKQYTNDHTTYGEITEMTENQGLINEMLQSLDHNNNHNINNHLENNDIEDPDMTVMEDDIEKNNHNHHNNNNSVRETQEFLSNKVINDEEDDGDETLDEMEPDDDEYKNEVLNDRNEQKVIKNEYILRKVGSNNESGVSLAWNDTNDEFRILEENHHTNHTPINYRKRKKKRKRSDENETGEKKYIEAVRGNKRNNLPGHECEQCAKFYALNRNLRGSTRNICNHVSRHRAKHKMPDTPDFFWKIDIPSQQSSD